MKNKFGWILIFIELGLIVWFGTKHWDEINKSINLLITPKIIETEVQKEMVEISKELEKLEPMATISPTPKVKKTIPTLTIKKIIYPTPTPDNKPWGVSQQIDEVTWTMKVGQDEEMATPREIWEALNEYRKIHGSQILNWDIKLGDYAQIRAELLNSNKTTDKHEGFSNFVNNEDGFNKLGFTALGENISYGYKLSGVHTIEWMYAGDKPHNDNQLDNRWNYVGVGVGGLATCLIFGTGKF